MTIEKSNVQKSNVSNGLLKLLELETKQCKMVMHSKC